ncbi:AbrB/MazE/SpoVT family DNA-binding domain-containing protein [bacterium]|nr:AbrB/MazE/SpoVT family DNA-binding domain-containing protein [bacterium]
MSKTVRITSKRQLTIPVEIFEKMGLKRGQNLLAEERDGALILTSAESKLQKLRGSLKVPKKYVGLEINDLVEQAKKDYFKKIYGTGKKEE